MSSSQNVAISVSFLETIPARCNFYEDESLVFFHLITFSSWTSTYTIITLAFTHSYSVCIDTVSMYVVVNLKI